MIGRVNGRLRRIEALVGGGDGGRVLRERLDRLAAAGREREAAAFALLGEMHGASWMMERFDALEAFGAGRQSK